MAARIRAHVLVRFVVSCGSFCVRYGLRSGHYDPRAVPVINNITFSNIVGSGSSVAVNLVGLIDSELRYVCVCVMVCDGVCCVVSHCETSNINLSNVHLSAAKGFECVAVTGTSHDVSPTPCRELKPVL
jgi:hypothetical protein